MDVQISCKYQPHTPMTPKSINPLERASACSCWLWDLDGDGKILTPSLRASECSAKTFKVHFQIPPYFQSIAIDSYITFSDHSRHAHFQVQKQFALREVCRRLWDSSWHVGVSLLKAHTKGWEIDSKQRHIMNATNHAMLVGAIGKMLELNN